jgi:arylesterase/paraoxonase
MKTLKRVLLIALVLALVFVGNVVISTGYFRAIENSFDGELVKRIALPGAEDITVGAVDSFAIVSSTKRTSYPSTKEEQGGLYLMELKSGDFNIEPLTASYTKAFAPHGISMLKKDSVYHLLAINHTEQGHSIEVFSLKNSVLSHQKTLSDKTMVSPNDVVMIDENRFYFTNDHGHTKGLFRLLEDYGGLPRSNVIYYDGNSFREVANGISYANGINFDPKRNLIFVASARKFLVKVYKRDSKGSLEFIEDIPCGTGVDNIEFDEDGNLWLGGHPNLLRFAAYNKGKEAHSPSEIIKIQYRGTKDYSVETVYLEDGTTMSASSVAAPFGDLILAGNVKDEAFLVLKYHDSK